MRNTSRRSYENEIVARLHCLDKQLETGILGFTPSLTVN